MPIAWYDIADVNRCRYKIPPVFHPDSVPRLSVARCHCLSQEDIVRYNPRSLLARCDKDHRQYRYKKPRACHLNFAQQPFPTLYYLLSRATRMGSSLRRVWSDIDETRCRYNL